MTDAVECVSNEKDLRVVVSANLKWEKQRKRLSVMLIKYFA